MSLPDASPPGTSFDGGPSADWMDARVEAYVDDALPPSEHAAFEARLQAAPRWQNAVRCARQVRDGLRARPRPSCPPEVTQAVLQEARMPQQATRTDRPAAPHATRPRPSHKPRAWQPSAALALLLVLAAAAALWGQPSPTDGADASFTPAEVQHATTEAEWTLAFLAQVTRETSTTVRDDVLGDRVAAPTGRAALRAFHHLPADSHLSPAPLRRHTDR